MVIPSIHSRFRSLIAVTSLVCLAGGVLCPFADGRSPSRARTAEAQTADESSRLSLLRGLIKQRAELARAGKTAELRACDAQIIKHPAPSEGNAAALARNLVGAWRSPRHDYLYRADGSWTMVPAERGTPHGNWHIAGNQLTITSGYAKPDSTERYTVMMIEGEDFVFADREAVFFEKRLPR